MIVKPPALIPSVVILGPVEPSGLPIVKPLWFNTVLPSVMLLRSVRSLAILTTRLPSSESTRKFASDASALLSKPPLTVKVSLSFFAITSPWLPANFKPSFKVATCCGPVPSSYTIRVVVSPGAPFTPAGPVAPVIVKSGVPGCPSTPSLPLSVKLSALRFLSIITTTLPSASVVVLILDELYSLSALVPPPTIPKVSPRFL